MSAEEVWQLKVERLERELVRALAQRDNVMRELEDGRMLIREWKSKASQYIALLEMKVKELERKK